MYSRLIAGGSAVSVNDQFGQRVQLGRAGTVGVHAGQSL
jgi:hypothetical protein